MTFRLLLTNMEHVQFPAGCRRRDAGFGISMSQAPLCPAMAEVSRPREPESRTQAAGEAEADRASPIARDRLACLRGSTGSRRDQPPAVD